MLIYIDMDLKETEKELLRSNTQPQFQLAFQDELRTDAARLEALKKADVILGNPRPDWLLQASKLQWIQLHSAGFEKYKGLSLSARTTNMQDFYSQPCAETMIAGILALYRKMDDFSLLKKEKQWVGAPIRMQLDLLYQKKVIILGTGNIGRRIAKTLSGFDAEIQFYGRSAADATMRSKDELLLKIPWADIIIATLPGTPETKGFFTSAMIRNMQPHALFCNVGRGNLLEDENVLVDALMHHKIGGAVLDVTATEPIPADSKLWTCPNTILSQHSGGGQKGEAKGIVQLFLENLQRFTQGQDLKNIVDFSRGY